MVGGHAVDVACSDQEGGVCEPGTMVGKIQALLCHGMDGVGRGGHPGLG